MELNKSELKEYLLDRSLLADDRYEVHKIQSITIGRNRIGNPYLDIVLQFTLNDDGKLYTDNICIDYQTFVNFRTRNRKKKIIKIKERCIQ